jgi:hypothetical protein
MKRGDMNSMAVTTADITKAAKELTSLERKLAKLVANEKAAVAKATAKALSKYAEKVVNAQGDVEGAKSRLRNLAAQA